MNGGFERHGRVALVRWANPPVNGLSFALRQHLSAALDAAVAHPIAVDGHRRSEMSQ